MAIISINPATGQRLKTFEPLSSAHTEEKLERASRNISDFPQSGIRCAAEKMNRAAEILENEDESLAHLITTEMGKTLRSAVDEVAKCSWTCRYFAANAERFLAD